MRDTLSVSRGEPESGKLRAAASVRGKFRLGDVTPARLTVLAIGVLAALGVVFLSRTGVVHDGKLYFSLADDAMISMTYAKNLAHGAGLVWIPGEAPVEGYTNPLWTVWMALMHVITPVDRWAPLLTALSGLACLMVGLLAANRVATRLGLSLPGRAFALLSAATLYAPIFWTLRGFEVGLLIAVQGWMLALALDLEDRSVRRGAVLGLLAAIAFLTRMDSVVMSGAILALRLSSLDLRQFRSLGVAIGVALAGAALLFIARFAYYHEFLPNTFYLKLESISLIQRLRQGLSVDWHAALRWAPLLVFAALAVALVKPQDKARRLALFGVLFVIGVQVAYTAYIGGDAWEWSNFSDRFLVLIAFPLCVAAGCGFGEGLKHLGLSQRSMAAATAAVAVLAFGWTSFGHWRDTLAGKGFQFDEEKYLVEAGLNLKESTPPGFRYALTWAGTIPYYAEGRRPIDLLGKMDKVIAHSQPAPGLFKPGHNKHDLNYSVLKLWPDAMLQPPVRDDDGAINRQMVAWGYLNTPGGWWILPAAAKTLSDQRILNFRFWWGSDGLQENASGSPDARLRDTPLPLRVSPASVAPAPSSGVPQPAVMTRPEPASTPKTARTGPVRNAPPRTTGNAPQRAVHQGR